MGDSKKSKRRRRDDSDNEGNGFARGSGVDYSKVADRHVDDARYEKHRAAAETTSSTPSAAAAASAADPSKTKRSSQMEAVYRIMTGKEERTIAEKLADSNRPTWEQYKKDNEDKLNLEGMDQKKMEQYRKELDEEREKILSRGINHGGKKKRKKKKKRSRYGSSDSGDESDDDNDRRRRHRKKHKKKRSSKKKHKRKYSDDSESSSDSDSNDSSSDEKRRKKKKRKSKKKDQDTNGQDDRYRLSNFFTKDDSDGD